MTKRRRGVEEASAPFWISFSSAIVMPNQTLLSVPEITLLHPPPAGPSNTPHPHPHPHRLIQPPSVAWLTPTPPSGLRGNPTASEKPFLNPNLRPTVHAHTLASFSHYALFLYLLICSGAHPRLAVPEAGTLSVLYNLVAAHRTVPGQSDPLRNMCPMNEERKKIT